MKKSEKGLPKKGMNRQTHPAELTSQEYSFALNANIQDEHGDGDLILVNEPSNIKCSGFKEGYVVIKHKYDRVRNRTYFFLVNETTGCSEIGYIEMTYNFQGNEALEKVCKCEIKVVIEDGLENIVQEESCEYITLISDYCALTGECTGCLGFSVNQPIKDVVIRHSQRGDELYFTDGNKPQRYLKVDEVQSYFEDVDDCSGEVEETCLDCEKLRIFNLYNFPCLTVDKIQNGGGLKAGVYESFIAYCTADGAELSDYLSLTNPVSIFDANNTVLDQTSLDYPTNQAFAINIDGLDNTYDYFKIVIASRTGNNPGRVYTTYGVFPTSQDRVIISAIPTIRDERKEVNEYDLLNRRPLYLTAEGLTQANEHLFQHGLTNQRVVNLQPVVSMMGGFVKWGTVEAFEKLYKDGANSALYKGYMRDEVYPYSIKFKMTGGYKTPNFLFIPRPPREDEIATISTSDTNYQSIQETESGCYNDGRDKVWQYVNTAKEENETCLEGNSLGDVQVDEEYTCESETEIVVGEGVFPEYFTESIAQYVLENTASILASTDPALVDIQDALNDPADYTDCTPTVSTNCTKPSLVSELIIVSSVEGEREEEVADPTGSYNDIAAPTTCSNLVYPTTTNTGILNALPAGSNVNQKNSPTNTACVSAVELFYPAIGSYHLDDKYQVGGNSSLLTSTNITLTSSVFKNKLHSNAIFFKVSSFSAISTIVKLSNVNCTSTDSNTNNSVRVTLFDGCPTLTEVPAYGTIISDLTTAPFASRIISLDASDFPSGVAYIAIDSPMREDHDVTLNLTGTSGSATITIGGVPYTTTFVSSLATTTSNFYAANSVAWTTAGLNPQFVSGVISFRMSGDIFDSIVVSSMSGNLDINYNSTEEYYTLQPPCGCIALETDTPKTKIIKAYDSISFKKQMTFIYECSYSQSIVTECEPAPYKQGLFSHWESTYKYPCNEELYDSSWLDISTSDIPSSIKSKFEEYYTSGTSGVNYTLNSETNFMDKPIRHYKFPDNRVSPFMKTQNASQSAKPDSLVYPIGFILDNEVINAFLDIAVKNDLITSEERAQITGYEIFRGDRATERSVIAKGLAFNLNEYNDKARADGAKTYYPNYPLNQIGADTLNGMLTTTDTNKAFTFHSPETHFNKPTLPYEFTLEGVQSGYVENTFAPFKDHPKYVVIGGKAKKLATTIAAAEAASELLMQLSEMITTGATGWAALAAVAIALAIAAGVAIAIISVFKYGTYRYEWLDTFEKLGEGHNHAYIGLAEGKYHNFTPSQSANSRLRRLRISTYLNSGYKEVVEEGLGGKSYFINNFQRESSVLLKLSDSFPISYDSWVNGYDDSRKNIPASEGISKTSSKTVAPYVSIKQFVPTQYNTVNSIQWLPVGYCGDLLDDNGCEVVFGGDIFISRMTLKRKFPFFTETAWKLSASTPYKYSSYFNINNGVKLSRGYLDFKTGLEEETFGSIVFPEPNSKYSLWDGSSWYSGTINEFYVKDKYKFLTYYYGIPNFLVESEINLNYRYAGIEAHEDFSPNVGDTIDWIQQSTVPITFDNEYRYNFVYSARPHGWDSYLLPVNYNRTEWDKLDDKSNGVIYSQQDDMSSSSRSPFLSYKVNDLHNFNKSFGDLVDVKGIESDQVWFRFTDGMIILGAVDSLKDRITESNKVLGIGGIFTDRSVNFNETELGNAGTQHKVSVSTEFGHYSVDAKRGKVHELQPGGKGISEISQSMDKWFKEQLPFKILKYYPNVNIDNAYGGIGISMGWDDRLKRLFITKLDYIPKVSNLQYSEELGFYGSGSATTCSPGYTWNGTNCFKTTYTTKTPSGTPLEVEDSTFSSYGGFGGAIYSAYNSNGTANVDALSTTGFTYLNLTGALWTGSPTTSNSFVNLIGKWIVAPHAFSTWYGATSIINITTTKTYYVALAADNYFRFKVDGITILSSAVSAMSVQHGLDSTSNVIAFVKVHLYPVVLEAGCHYITIQGSDQGGNAAMFSGAILDNTSTEIETATTLADLNFVYSTGTETFFYENTPTSVCPEGFTPSGEGFCDTCYKEEIEEGIAQVSLLDENYFEKAYWTIGYSPLTKNWISYYSFYPNYYNSYNEYFQTGINNLSSSTHGLWTHHPFISSYQVFYGVLQPFIVEIAGKSNLTDSYMESVQFYLDVRKYYNMYDFSDTFGRGFNKAYIYNNFQNSGLLELKFQEGNNQRQLIEYPKYKSNSIEVLQSEIEGKWSFNFLYNSVKNERQGLPIWENDNVQVLKYINNSTIDYRAIRRDRIRGDYFLTRLIQDEDSRNKMFFRSIDITRNYNV